MAKPTTPREEDFDTSALAALAELRDTLGEATDEDRDQLRSWEKMIKGHALRKHWLKNPITAEVFELLMKRVVSISARLSTEEDMKEDTRRAIFSEKKAYTWLLTLFSDAKDDTVLVSLASEIQERTRAFEEFNRTNP
jgi:hypothetical protein